MIRFQADADLNHGILLATIRRPLHAPLYRGLTRVPLMVCSRSFGKFPHCRTTAS
jgi:hypothetical protein